MCRKCREGTKSITTRASTYSIGQIPAYILSMDLMCICFKRKEKEKKNGLITFY